MTKSKKNIYGEFTNLVNMSSCELEDWLQTDASKSVGQDSGDGEAIGHKSGKKIIEIINKAKEKFKDSDYEHMQKVSGYIKRHRAQEPDGEIKDTNWRYSLMNWGHDPLQK